MTLTRFMRSQLFILAAILATGVSWPVWASAGGSASLKVETKVFEERQDFVVKDGVAGIYTQVDGSISYQVKSASEMTGRFGEHKSSMVSTDRYPGKDAENPGYSYAALEPSPTNPASVQLTLDSQSLKDVDGQSQLVATTEHFQLEVLSGSFAENQRLGAEVVLRFTDAQASAYLEGLRTSGAAQASGSGQKSRASASFLYPKKTKQVLYSRGLVIASGTHLTYWAPPVSLKTSASVDGP